MPHKGILKLYHNDELVTSKTFYDATHRKQLMIDLAKLYSLKNKEHYWQVEFSDDNIADNGIAVIKNKRIKLCHT